MLDRPEKRVKLGHEFDTRNIFPQASRGLLTFEICAPIPSTEQDRNSYGIGMAGSMDRDGSWNICSLSLWSLSKGNKNLVHWCLSTTIWLGFMEPFYKENFEQQSIMFRLLCTLLRVSASQTVPFPSASMPSAEKIPAALAIANWWTTTCLTCILSKPYLALERQIEED